MVLPASHGIPRAPRYSGSSLGRHILFTYRTITCYGPTFQKSSVKDMLCNFPAARYCNHTTPHNPSLPTRTGLQQSRFRLLPFRSPLLGQSKILSFPGGTKMVQFPPLPSLTYEFSQGYPDKSGWVIPFGDPRIKVCLPLPEAYRSLPRPSSATNAKAFAIYP